MYLSNRQLRMLLSVSAAEGIPVPISGWSGRELRTMRTLVAAGLLEQHIQVGLTGAGNEATQDTLRRARNRIKKAERKEMVAQIVSDLNGEASK
jgi:hypothetical protein